MSKNVENKSIPVLLESAMRGEREAFTCLLSTITKSTFIVPERIQNQPLNNSPEYPNDLMTLLGVQANDRVVIPIFSSAELVREWCGVELSTRQVSFDALVASTPKDWWWGLNLGSGVEKEFSPWEIDLLRGGAQNFPAIINEALEDSIAIPVNLGPFEEHENRGLVEALKQLGTSDSRIQRITVAREESITEDDQTVFSILIGVLTKESDHARATEAVRSAAAPALIGAEPLKVFVGNDENAVMLGAFKGLAPLFQRQQPAWWHKIFALCSR